MKLKLEIFLNVLQCRLGDMVVESLGIGFAIHKSWTGVQP